MNIEIKACSGILGIAARRQANFQNLNTRNGSGAFAIFIGVCLNVLSSRLPALRGFPLCSGVSVRAYLRLFPVRLFPSRWRMPGCFGCLS